MDVETIISRIESDIYDNTTGGITPAVLRNLLEYIVTEIADSLDTSASYEEKIYNAYERAFSLRTNAEQDTRFLNKSNFEQELSESQIFTSLTNRVTIVEGKVDHDEDFLAEKYPGDYDFPAVDPDENETI